MFTILCLLGILGSPGDPGRPVPPVATATAGGFSPHELELLQALQDKIDTLRREMDAEDADRTTWERDQIAWEQSEQLMLNQHHYILFAWLTIDAYESAQAEVRRRTGLKLPTPRLGLRVHAWPRVRHPKASQAIKDAEFLQDYSAFKTMMIVLKTDVSIFVWRYTGKWIPTPAFFFTELKELPPKQ